MFAKTGPSRNSKDRVGGFQIDRPVMSVGCRSGVHWIRLATAPSMLPAIARASTVLAVPGDVLEQHVTARRERGDHERDRLALAEHDGLDVPAQIVRRPRSPRRTTPGRRFTHRPMLCQRRDRHGRRRMLHRPPPPSRRSVRRSLLDGERSGHAELGVARDVADVRVLAGLLEDDLEGGRLSRPDHLRRLHASGCRSCGGRCPC